MADITKRQDTNGATQIMGGAASSESRTTDLMDSSRNNATAIMGRNTSSGYVPTGLAVGSQFDEYTVVDVVAENTGEATLLLAEKNNQQFVLKIYHKGKAPKQELIDLLKKVDSVNVIHTIGSGTYGDRVYSVLPFFKRGDLLQNMPISLDLLQKTIIPCVNDALHALHSVGIIHRDIKPSNLFLSDDGKAVIVGDFGISSVLQSKASVRVTSMSRTLGYAAPETSTGYVSKESDYYSLGITLYHLILGQDPFLGMSDAEILFQTINKKIDLPQTIPYRLQTLIRGLTVKDRADRWGYEQVSKWLNNEEVEVVETVVKEKGKKPYQFNRQYFYSLEALSMAFATNWENAKKHLYRGFVEKNILQYGEDFASEAIDLKNLSDQDAAVFKLIRMLNPGAPLCYRGKIYNDLTAVGNAMRESLPHINEDIMFMIMNGCFLQYLLESGFDNSLVSFVERCTKKINEHEPMYYYAIMYILSEEKGYNLDERYYLDLKDMIEDFGKLSPLELETKCSKLFSDEKFAMWVYSKGFTRQVEDWLNVYGSQSLHDVEQAKAYDQISPTSRKRSGRLFG